MPRDVNEPIGDTLAIHQARSFADLMEQLESMRGIGATRRRDLISAVRRTGSILGGGRPLVDIDAHPGWIRRRIGQTAPAAHNISPKSWRNLTSGLTRALQLCGVTRATFRIELTGRWAELQREIRSADDKSLRTGLSRFPRFCQANGLMPDTVTDATILAYRDHLAREEIVRDPHRSAYYAARAWNRAVDLIDGWPQIRLAPPLRSNAYALPWSGFPASLEVDVDAWLSRAASDDIFDLEAPSWPSAPSTRRGRKGAIQRFASALVHDGVDPETLRSLSDLVPIETLKRGLRWLMVRLGGKPTGGLGNVAIALKLAARWYVKVGPEHQEQIDLLVGRVAPRQKGMVPKNRARIEPFKQRETVFGLLTLPERMIAGLHWIESPERCATTFETALAISILTYCPIRFGNLRGMEIDRHIVRLRASRGRERTVIVFPDPEVKNRREITLVLPPAIERMVRVFITEHRPSIVTSPSRFLFSKRSGDAPTGPTSLSKRITDAIRADLGLTLTPHNFRHLAGLVYLQVNPEAYDVVRRLLGHAETSTATDAYTGLEVDAAHAAYTRLLDEIRRGSHDRTP